MKRSCAARLWRLAVVVLAAASPAASRAAAAEKGPANLALEAEASASSEYSRDYSARFACDGKIAGPMGGADVGKAWAAMGNAHPKGVTFTLKWPVPVTVGEVVYYGRTAFQWQENWKSYELYVNDEKRPTAIGTFGMGHGPQRIKLARPVEATDLTLKFLDSFNGSNPGAAEVQVYAASPPEGLLGKFVAPPADGGAGRGGRRATAPAPPPIQDSPELAARLKAGELGFAKLLLVQRHHVRCSHCYTYHTEGQRDGGGMYVYDVAAGSLEKILDSPDGQILSAELSYDGKEVVFAWRKGTYYHLYRVGVDGADLKQLTRGEHHNYDCCWLPDGGIAYNSTRTPLYAYCWTTLMGVLHRMDRDGENIVRLSANYLTEFTPTVLDDGRIIYGRWEYVDRPAIPIQSLWTINPDGTNLAAFYGNRVLDPATFIEARQIPHTSAVLSTLCGHNGSIRGGLAIIDPIHGNNAQEAMRNVTPEIRLRGVNVSSNGPHGPYQTPWPLDAQHFLVSHDGTILLRDYDRTEQTIVVGPQEGLGFYNPQPIRPRFRPPVRFSNLPANAGPWATVYLQDVYNGLGPAVKRGEIKQICVAQEVAKPRVGHSTGFGFQRPVVSCGATYVPKKVWGFVPVSEDGSAYFKVPACQPIYFMALDAQGRAVQRMRSFTHLMPGEVQGCIGCHERRTHSPTAQPGPSAVARQVHDLDPPEWGLMGFDYSRIVQPVLDKHCVRCHNARRAPANVDLSGDRTEWFNVSYDVLAHEGSNLRRGGSGYTNWISTMNGAEANILEIEPRTWGSPRSKLADVVLAGHPDKDGKRRVDLSAAERQRILTWIDLNVPYYGTSLTNLPQLRGGRSLRAAALPKALADVAARRCAECHKGGRLPAGNRLRITNPQNNAFLLAPLSKAAGGTEKCGQPVFADTDDADYQAILKAFEPVLNLLKEQPRMDLPGSPFAACGCPAEKACPEPDARRGAGP